MGQRHCNEIFSALRVDVGPVEWRCQGEWLTGKLHVAVLQNLILRLLF